MTEWQELQKAALFSEEDVFYLRLSGEVLAGRGRRPAQNLARYCFRPPVSAGLRRKSEDSRGRPRLRHAVVELPIFGQSSSTNLQIEKSLGVFVEDLFFDLAG